MDRYQVSIQKVVRPRDRSIFQLALLEARNSQCRYRFGAVIARGRCILSIAPNIIKTHPKQMLYHQGCITIHAELNAILKCQGNTLGSSLYVARWGKSTISKPCASCLLYILESGIREIIFSNGYELVRVGL